MWDLIAQKGMPMTRTQRWCCAILKENGGAGAVAMTGVRWAESYRRRTTRGIYESLGSNPHNKLILADDNDENRGILENCTVKRKMMCKPHCRLGKLSGVELYSLRENPDESTLPGRVASGRVSGVPNGRTQMLA
jgi:hypothetical protein